METRFDQLSPEERDAYVYEFERATIAAMFAAGTPKWQQAYEREAIARRFILGVGPAPVSPERMLTDAEIFGWDEPSREAAA